MYRFKQHSARSAFKAILQNAPAPTAVLMFPHGIEVLPIRSSETDLHEQKQAHGLLADYREYLVGIYNAGVRLDDLIADIDAVKMELLLNDDFDETVD